jgi:hypothetical protein
MLRKKIGNFYLVQNLGSGGTADVFLAINPRTREKRVYRIFGRRAAKEYHSYTRFLREVDLVRRLDHPGIAKILDSGIFEGGCYYSMEYFPKGSLNRPLARGKMSLDKAIDLILRICEAVAHAHARGIAHGNLKPSNIFFNASGEPVVVDFGFAADLEHEAGGAAGAGKALGKIEYQAPERRFEAQKPSQRADIYSLGAIFYEMLMGFPPLGEFPWPADVQSDFPEPLQSILEKCLAVRPEARYENAGNLHLDLAKCIACTGSRESGMEDAAGGGFMEAEDLVMPRTKTDRIEAWFRILRTGTAKERLATVREMVEKIEPGEVRAALKLYAEESDRVRWGLMRVLGELKIQSATPLILNDLRNPFHTECALEALGRIGSDEAYNAIRSYVTEHPENAAKALLPLARTGKQKGIRYLRRYLNSEITALRQAAVQALATVASEECLRALKEHLCVEKDEKVRSSLFQAVHSIQSTLLPDIDMPPHMRPS